MEINQIVLVSVGVVTALFIVVLAISFLAYKMKGNSNVRIITTRRDNYYY